MDQTDPLAKLHPSEWEFRFRSGRLCLDFIATVGDREHMPFDRWRGTQDLGRWCVAAGLISRAGIVGDGQIEAARGLRETLFRLFTAALAGTRPSPADLRHVNEAARKPAFVPQLAGIGQPHDWASDSPYESVLATVARDAIDLLSSPALARVRKCADGHCSILFLDTSRPGKRRWCAMNGCGNKVKKAAYRKRQKR
ncbi:CGNR zinc finger domain-containing protein [Taklimakanibacter deserti]|uniref:CGNR zinc finger domain-containing protein n=1 Tax=Taklimakanibacter deserti TaxID=2267839 RepID=UPI000E64E474